MKRIFFTMVVLLFTIIAFAQKTSIKEIPMPCNGSADLLPGKYTDHTNPKYPTNLKGTAQDRAAMTKQLIALEKLEEASRNNFPTVAKK